ncbi:MAG TPA: NAAT family transporter [Gemmatimonadaceae bacterium]|nr:NAAT family transporter [Gemmatimonadaceae bacterium]
MNGFLQFALITFTSVLFIVDPIAVIPTYLVITQSETSAQRRATARRACIATGLMLIVFALAGRLIFRLFGITLPAFRVAGGLILWLVAMDMLRGERRTQESPTEIREGKEKEDVAITPLAIPMLAGPGAISTVIVLAGQAHSAGQHIVVYASIIVTAVLSWLALLLGERLVSYLGQTGIRVTTRIMGLLLAAVAVQFVLTGVKDGLGQTIHAAAFRFPADVSLAISRTPLHRREVFPLIVAFDS